MSEESRMHRRHIEETSRCFSLSQQELWEWFEINFEQKENTDG